MSKKINTIIDPIHTSCKDCVFSVYNNNTQVNCAINMIEKYQAKYDSSIIEAYDDDKEFFIINKYKCIGHRKQSWFNSFSDFVDTMEYKINKTQESNHLNYILVIDLKTMTLDNLEYIYKDISSLLIKPKKIILIRYDYTNKLFNFESIRNIMQKYSIVCSWRIQTMVAENIELRSILSSIANLNKLNRFILYITDYSDKIKNIIDKGEKIVFDDLSHFSLITNTENTVSLFSTIVYRYMWFLEGRDILNIDSETIII